MFCFLPVVKNIKQRCFLTKKTILLAERYITRVTCCKKRKIFIFSGNLLTRVRNDKLATCSDFSHKICNQASSAEFPCIDTQPVYKRAAENHWLSGRRKPCSDAERTT